MKKTQKTRRICLSMMLIVLLLTACAGVPEETPAVQPEPTEAATQQPEDTVTPEPSPTDEPEEPTKIPVPTLDPALVGMSLDGRWAGEVSVAGQIIPMEVVFATNDEELKAFLDIQTVFDYQLSEVSYDGINVHFEGFAEANREIIWDGSIQPDGSISGEFTQLGYTGTFSIMPKIEIVEELPYLAEEVEFQNGDINLAGTLTLPEGEGPFPTVVLISGSGAQNRDENIYGFRIFGEIADHLTRGGIAVLRYDDRGVGGSDGDLLTSTSQDLSGDVLAAVELLKTRAEIDDSHIGLLGHSEGGYIAPMTAAQSEDIAMLILLSGPAMPGEEVIYDQIELLMRADGATDEEVEASINHQKEVFEALLAGGQIWDDYKISLREQLVEQVDALPAAQKETLGDLDAYVENIYQAQLLQLESAWYQFFLTYDPAEDLQKVTVPVLALYGGLDLQVPAEENKVLLEESLAAAGNTQVTTTIYPSANHLFQEAITGSTTEYAELDKAFVDGLLEQIRDWILEQ